MAHTARVPNKTHEHREAVELLEELASFLHLPMDYVRDLAEQVTGKPWEELDKEDAEEVARVLAEALQRTLAEQAARVR